MKALPYTWPYALVFWGVFVWAYTPEFGVVRRAQRVGRSDKSLSVIVYAQAISSALSFAIGWRLLPFAASSRVPLFFAGLVLVIAGSLLRRHCWRMLGTSFTGEVRASSDQQVVSRGAYRFVRHPSYTAGLMLNTGLGIALGSWVSTLLMFVFSLVAYVYRMRVEERTLAETIGEPYRQFMRTRKRLVPYIY